MNNKIKNINKSEENNIEYEKFNEGENENNHNDNICNNKFKKCLIFFIVLILIILLIVGFISYINNSRDIQYFGTKDMDELNEIALYQKHLPYPMSLHFLNLINAAFLNVFTLIKMNKNDINIRKLIKSIYISLFNHPCLLSQFHREKDNITYINYRPDILPKIDIIKINDISKLNKNTLLNTFNPYDNPMFNITIFDLENENNIYIFFDFFHSNIDGTGFINFLNSVEKAYNNEILPKDYYFLHLKEYNKIAYNNAENNEYLNKFDLKNDYNIKYDSDIPENILNKKGVSIIFKSIESKEIKKKLEKIYGNKLIKYNIFYSMTILLSNYIYSNYSLNYQQLKVGFNGRNFKKEKYTVGCLITNIPIKYEFIEKKLNLKEFEINIENQINKGKRYPKFIYEHTSGGSIWAILQRKDSFIKNEFLGKKCEFVYHYENLYNINSEININPLMIEFIVGKEEVNFHFVFDGKKYKESSTERYKNIFEKVANIILNNYSKIIPLNLHL